MKNLPLVSILIPTYNQPEYFRQALESALNQTYPNIEIIVSDDSTDNRVERVASEYKDRIQFFKHGKDYRNESASERALLNIDNSLELSHGEFVNILLHDDIIYPQKISKMMKFFTGNDGDRIAIVSSARDLIDNNGNFLGRVDLVEQMNFYGGRDSIFFTGDEVGRLIFMVCGNFISEFSTVLMRREDFYRSYIGKFSTRYCFGIKDRSMGDISAFLEACKNDRGLIFIRESLSAFRSAGENQNTFNVNVRINLVIDWLAIATGLYLQKMYLRSWKDFEFACDYWIFLAQRMLGFFQQNQNAKISIDAEILDQVLQAVESIGNHDYDSAFKIGVSWIQKYSSVTFDARYLP